MQREMWAVETCIRRFQRGTDNCWEVGLKPFVFYSDN